MATKCSCGAATDAFVCVKCLDAHAKVLGDIPALMDECVVTLMRMDRIGHRVGSRSAEKPLPIGWEASLAIETATDTLDAWVSEVKTFGRLPDTPFGKVALLLSNMGWFAVNPAGPQAVDEFSYLHGVLSRTVDLPVQRWFAGLCDSGHGDSDSQSSDAADSHARSDSQACGAPLYAPFGASHVRCPACGLVYTAESRREWLVREAEAALLPLRIIWAALGTLAGSRPAWAVVRQWPERTGTRRLHARGLSLGGDELYRVGDVLDLVHSYPGRKKMVPTRKNF